MLRFIRNPIYITRRAFLRNTQLHPISLPVNYARTSTARLRSTDAHTHSNPQDKGPHDEAPFSTGPTWEKPYGEGHTVSKAKEVLTSEDILKDTDKAKEAGEKVKEDTQAGVEYGKEAMDKLKKKTEEKGKSAMEMGESAKEKGKDMMHKTKEMVEEEAHKAKEAVKHAVDSGEKMAKHVGHKVNESAADVADKIYYAKESINEKARHGKESMENKAESIKESGKESLHSASSESSAKDKSTIASSAEPDHLFPSPSEAAASAIETGQNLLHNVKEKVVGTFSKMMQPEAADTQAEAAAKGMKARAVSKKETEHSDEKAADLNANIGMQDQVGSLNRPSHESESNRNPSTSSGFTAQDARKHEEAEKNQARANITPEDRLPRGPLKETKDVLESIYPRKSA
ncbi:18_t:CDS:2 [Paraglomus occultum]|uniref:18_t:CDS:1 n=1 Tax=Paraglomus occultum TaxID=144539 RepID=A0A9N9C5M8_9GLOM|nr:18_t:CDS:2 [Paraglomus occultum]